MAAGRSCPQQSRRSCLGGLRSVGQPLCHFVTPPPQGEISPEPPYHLKTRNLVFIYSLCKFLPHSRSIPIFYEKPSVCQHQRSPAHRHGGSQLIEKAYPALCTQLKPSYLYLNGSTRLPFSRTSRWRCSPADQPVQPTSAITSPRVTCCPFCTKILRQCA